MNFSNKSFFLMMLLFSAVTNVNASESDSLGVVITQNAHYLMPGERFELSVLSQCEVEKRISYVVIGNKKTMWKRGKAMTYGFEAESEPGEYKIPIKIVYTTGKNQVHNERRSITYVVAQPSFATALDRMNILYIGVDNPISVATSYGGADKVRITITKGGSVSMVGPGKYIVHVTAPSDECRISVFADDKLVGVSQFRIRHLPQPIGTVGGFTSGDSVNIGAFRAQQGVGAFLNDFSFDLRYEIIGYDLVLQNEKGEIKTAACNGTYFSAGAREILEQMRPGAVVTIGNLYAKAQDGSSLKLLPLVYFIK